MAKAKVEDLEHELQTTNCHAAELRERLSRTTSELETARGKAKLYDEVRMNNFEVNFLYLLIFISCFSLLNCSIIN